MALHYLSAGDGPLALVLLHGIGGAAAMWREQLPVLGRDGTRAIAVDMPGYGRSAPCTPYTFERFAELLVEMIDTLDAQRVIVLGHSMGGMVAQTLYAVAPDKVQGLVLTCTSPAFGKADGEWQRQFVAARLAPLDAGKTMSDVAAQIVPGMLGPNADASAREDAQRVMGSVPSATYRAALNALVSFDRRALLPSIAVPTLVLAAEHDKSSAPLVMEKMAARIPAAEYHCVPDAGHLLPMERPQAFNELVLSFLHRRFA